MKESPFSQIRLVELSEGIIKVFVKIQNFHTGDIHLHDFDGRGVFYSVPRTFKNVFHLFGKPALCYNIELLNLNLYSIMKIKYDNQFLSVPRLKFMNEGIRSPFSNERVDSQLALFIEKINMNDSEKYLFRYAQQELFAEVI